MEYSYVLEFLQNKPLYTLIIYIDESGFSISMRRSLGRSISGTRANLKVKTIRSKNITLIAAMSSEKVWTLHVECDSVNQNVFYTFIEKLFNDLSDDGVEKALHVMNKIRFHKTDLIIELIQTSNHKRLFLPSYSLFH